LQGIATRRKAQTSGVYFFTPKENDMDKCSTLYCPDCGHHVYFKHGNVLEYFCIECQQDFDFDELARLDDVRDLRAKWEGGDHD
jgi:DNA-directed RNA polymerase subunit RPC12/RpoP